MAVEFEAAMGEMFYAKRRKLGRVIYSSGAREEPNEYAPYLEPDDIDGDDSNCDLSTREC